MIVRFLVWLPDSVFVLMIKALAFTTDLFHRAAKEEIRRNNPKDGLNKKRLMQLYEAMENNRRMAMK